MDIETARAMLGVAADTPADEVRRTYLRLVRKYGPETAPQEFQRIREAYDVLRAAAAGVPPPSTVPPSAGQPSAGPVRDASGAPVDPGAAPTPADAGAGALGTSPALAAVLEALTRVPLLAAEARAGVVERAMEEHPDDPRFLWLAVEELAPYPYVHERLRKLLRAAADRRLPGAVEQLTFFAPRLVRDDERAALLDSDNPNARLVGARVLIATGNGAAAVVVVDEVVGDATRIVPAGLVIDLALACLGQGDVASAGAIASSLRAHFDTFHDEAAVLTPALAALWGLLREALELARDFPVSALMSLARVARGEGVDTWIDVGRTLLNLPNLPHDKKMVALLAKRAPIVSQILDMPLVLRTYGRDATRVTPKEFVLGAFFLFGVVGIRACVCTAVEDAVTGNHGAVVSSNISAEEAQKMVAEIQARHDPNVTHLVDMKNSTCEYASNDVERADCAAMTAIASTLEAQVCDRSLLAFQLRMGETARMTEFRRLAREPAAKFCAREGGDTGAANRGGGAP
jgi:hypothetical protein